MQILQKINTGSIAVGVILFCNLSASACIAKQFSCKFEVSCSVTGECQEADHGIVIDTNDSKAMVSIAEENPRTFESLLPSADSDSWIFRQNGSYSYWEVLQLDISQRVTLVIGGSHADTVFSYSGTCTEEGS